MHSDYQRQHADTHSHDEADKELRKVGGHIHGKTVLTFRQGVFESVASRDEHEAGWSSAFELLTEYLPQA